MSLLPISILSLLLHLLTFPHQTDSLNTMLSSNLEFTSLLVLTFLTLLHFSFFSLISLTKKAVWTARNAWTMVTFHTFWNLSYNHWLHGCWHFPALSHVEELAPPFKWNDYDLRASLQKIKHSQHIIRASRCFILWRAYLLCQKSTRRMFGQSFWEMQRHQNWKGLGSKIKLQAEGGLQWFHISVKY